MPRPAPRLGFALIPLLVLGLVAGTPAAASAGSRSVPKVAIIVGPAGDATDHYRAAAAAAAAIARQYTPDVVEVISPNATWPAVRAALQHASLVVYLGHGNGWPSRYRPNLYPPSQNGLGLNPVPGVDDVAHQYFGEAYLESDVQLAPNAVVVLSHLCYASGNSEPGLPEGTLDVARQRVDNMAAGWIAAGARAVVAEASLDPAWYVRSLLAGSGSVRGAWNASPTFNGNVTTFPSERRSGFVDVLDPQASGGPGFDRSLVIRGSVSASSMVASGQGSANVPVGGTQPVVPPPPPPTLASVGAKVDTPTLSGLPVAAAKRTLTVPIRLPRGAPSSLVDGLGVSVRWDALDVPVVAPTDGGSVDPSVSPTSTTDASAGASPAPTTDPAVDPFALVVPEVPGDVVDPVPAKQTKTGWRISSTLPSTPGLYLLTVGLHGKDGVALDPATQALVPQLLVRVVGSHSATVVAPAAISAASGSSITLPVRVRNSGSVAWAVPQLVSARPSAAPEPVGPVRVTAHWVPLGAADGTPADAAFELNREVAPNDAFEAPIPLVVPASGSWLVVLDVETPETPSLVAAGSPATVVRVTATPAVSQPGAPRG